MKLISVIIPCYNTEKYITDCLDSVINQTFPDWEIICVNDGSKDKTLEILELYRNNYSEKITVISVPNAGASAARNTGLRLAKGDFIQFIDADDVITKDKFEKQIKGFSDEIDCVVSDRTVKSVDLSETINEFNFNEINNNPLETAVTKIIITGNPIYRKQIVDALGGYNINLKSSQDWDFHIRLVLAGFTIKYIPGAFYINRKVEGSISSNWKKVSIDAAELIIDLKQQLEKSPILNNATRQHLAQIYMNSAIFCKDKTQSEKFTLELKYWANGNFSFISNKYKILLLNIIGIHNLIKLYRYLNN